MQLFQEFIANRDTCRVYSGRKLIFVSRKDRLIPLMEYITDFSPYYQQVTIFDKIMGNAAALLAVKANCRKVFSPLGSQLAVRTLDMHGVGYYFNETVSHI